jgi:hypothetical protein
MGAFRFRADDKRFAKQAPAAPERRHIRGFYAGAFLAKGVIGRALGPHQWPLGALRMSGTVFIPRRSFKLIATVSCLSSAFRFVNQ